jgi:glycosyltransferase involved in cell wall biosynthesis
VRDKGIAELIAAFRTLSQHWPALRLLLVGDFEEGDAVPLEIRDYISTEPRIIKTGYVSDPAPYYHLMNVFILPTYREGLPGTALEAQAAGVPVVTTRATGAIDSIVDGVTGSLVPVGDAPALGRAIDALLHDAGMRARIGTAGQARAKMQFAPEIVWRAIARLYAELTANRRGSPIGNCPDCDPAISKSVTSATAD